MKKLITLMIMALLLTGCDGFTTIEGTVRDSTGKPVKDVKLVLKIYDRQLDESKSNEEGAYSLFTSHAPIKVQPIVIASKNGYKSYQHEFPPNVGKKHKLDIILEIDPVPAEEQSEKKENDSKSPRGTQRTKLRHHHC